MEIEISLISRLAFKWLSFSLRHFTFAFRSFPRNRRLKWFGGSTFLSSNCWLSRLSFLTRTLSLLLHTSQSVSNKVTLPSRANSWRKLIKLLITLLEYIARSEIIENITWSEIISRSINEILNIVIFRLSARVSLAANGVFIKAYFLLSVDLCLALGVHILVRHTYVVPTASLFIPLIITKPQTTLTTLIIYKLRHWNKIPMFNLVLTLCQAGAALSV